MRFRGSQLPAAEHSCVTFRIQGNRSFLMLLSLRRSDASASRRLGAGSCILLWRNCKQTRAVPDALTDKSPGDVRVECDFVVDDHGGDCAAARAFAARFLPARPP